MAAIKQNLARKEHVGNLVREAQEKMLGPPRSVRGNKYLVGGTSRTLGPGRGPSDVVRCAGSKELHVAADTS